MKMIGMLVVAMSVSGCATYNAIGIYSNKDDMIVGKVHHDLLAGGSRFELASRNSGLSCEGSTTVSKVSASLSCKGQKGEIFAACTDGSSLRGEWFSTTCTQGVGYLNDSTGGKMSLKFGLSDQEVEDEIKRNDVRKEKSTGIVPGNAGAENEGIDPI